MPKYVWCNSRKDLTVETLPCVVLAEAVFEFLIN
jgi:hypothetical protein